MLNAECRILRETGSAKENGTKWHRLAPKQAGATGAWVKVEPYHTAEVQRAQGLASPYSASSAVSVPLRCKMTLNGSHSQRRAAAVERALVSALLACAVHAGEVGRMRTEHYRPGSGKRHYTNSTNWHESGSNMEADELPTEEFRPVNYSRLLVTRAFLGVALPASRRVAWSFFDSSVALSNRALSASSLILRPTRIPSVLSST